ncbi:MAG: VOC family protein [Alphaproteobacteria bacterium]|nr:VOC family protein [Alphaproteobacteria bacterium]
MTDHKKNLPTMIPYLTVKNARNSLDFYKRAFGFTLLNSTEVDNGGEICHVEMQYKDVLIMFAPEGAFGGTTKAPVTLGTEPSMNLYLYCDNVDTFFNHALKAGATSLMEPNDAFWGDRVCQLKDPDGFMWMFAKTLTKD